MEDVDWPTKIIRDDFLLSEIKTSSNFTVTEPLDINATSCPKNDNSFKFSTLNDLLIKGILLNYEFNILLINI